MPQNDKISARKMRIMTVSREFELVFQDNLPIIDKALARVEERLRR